MAILALVFIKLASYVALFLLAFMAFAVQRRSVWLACKFGLARFLVGLLFGIAGFFLYAELASRGAPELSSYVLVFTALRLAAWAIVASRALRAAPRYTSGRLALFVVVGVVANFALDRVAVGLGADQIKFVC